MIYKHVLLLSLLMVFLLVGSWAHGQQSDSIITLEAGDSVRIDSIEIQGNWITWDRIILNELLFEEGDWVNYGAIDTSMNKVWNIGNFAEVNYSIREDPEGNILQIRALDGLQIFPIVAIDHSSENDYRYRLGMADSNFLGSNSKLKIVWDKRPTGATWDFGFTLPRQLMYKNMTVSFGTRVGLDTKIFYDREIYEVDGKKEAEYVAQMIAPYHKLDIYTSIGNPWHQDYTYRFSPNLSLRYMNDVYDSTLLDQEDLDLGVHVEDGTFRFFNVSISESIGTVDRKRHRKNGYTIGASYGLYAGLQGTKSHHVFGLGGEYHRSFTPLFQLSTEFRTGYTTAYNQYRFIKGSSDVLGIRLGEIYGKSYYSAYTGAHFTWLNSKWLSLENAYFLNWGNGADTYSELLGSKQKFSVGTFLEIKVPVVSWIEFRFTFMYAGPGGEWFKFNM